MPRSQPHTSAQPLIADYQTVFVSTATTEAALYEANRSENALISQLESISSGTYLNPAAIPGTYQDDVTRASLDAHIKKVQADQLHSMNQSQIAALVEQARSTYRNRKIQVTITAPQKEPVEMVWFDEQHGYRSSIYKKQRLSGIIEDVLLDRNILLLKPTLSMRLINSRLQNYICYVIDPETLSPMIDVTII